MIRYQPFEKNWVQSSSSKTQAFELKFIDEIFVSVISLARWFGGPVDSGGCHFKPSLGSHVQWMTSLKKHLKFYPSENILPIFSMTCPNIGLKRVGGWLLTPYLLPLVFNVSMSLFFPAIIAFDGFQWIVVVWIESLGSTGSGCKLTWESHLTKHHLVHSTRCIPPGAHHTKHHQVPTLPTTKHHLMHALTLLSYWSDKLMNKCQRHKRQYFGSFICNTDLLGTSGSDWYAISIYACHSSNRNM